MAAEPAPKGRRRFRVPTSLLVTLVGIALSAWLVPAITRQWDDRQKAHELKTAIVADIASATARALTGGEAIWSGRSVDRRRLADDWSVASLATEARLRAYFPQRVVTAWQVYSWMIDRFANGHRAQAEAGLLSAMRAHYPLSSDAADAAAIVLVTAQKRPPGIRGPSFETKLPLERLAVDELRAHIRRELRRNEASLPGFYGNRALEATLLIFEERLTRELLHAHASGYSTSTRDLLRDLVP